MELSGESQFPLLESSRIFLPRFASSLEAFVPFFDYGASQGLDFYQFVFQMVDVSPVKELPQVEARRRAG